MYLPAPRGIGSTCRSPREPGPAPLPVSDTAVVVGEPDRMLVARLGTGAAADTAWPPPAPSYGGSHATGTLSAMSRAS